MTAFPWTDEQKSALAGGARITLVQAGPGSGKTKVFAELVDQKLRAWDGRPGGLAALSFTNVARAEIESRVSSILIAPHFVGTLDAFFLRFVIAPFGHLVGLPKTGARLIPSPLDEQLTEPTVKISDKFFSSIFQMTAAGGTEAAPQFQIRSRNGLPATKVPTAMAAEVLKLKREEWSKRGRVTHGDCSYLAASILVGAHGAKVRALLARRFSVICIDEFQDTGHFLGRAVLSLLAEPSIESVLVGDADQKIFGFSGVSPNLFGEVEALAGAKKHPLQISQRCGVKICSVASHLSRSKSKVVPAGKAVEGGAFLTAHKDKGTQIALETLDAAIKSAREYRCADLAVLVRTRLTKARFLRTTIKSKPGIAARGVAQITASIAAVKQGNGRRAVDIVEMLLCRILFDDERPREDELRKKGIERRELRQMTRRLILRVLPVVPGETWRAWADRAKDLCDAVATACGISDHKYRLGGAFKGRKGDSPEDIRSEDGPSAFEWPRDVGVDVLTVHEAKGREFDAVLYYSPLPRKTGSISNCPSEAWWALPATGEEREVAFVATTRAKKLLIVSVHEKTWAALSAVRKEFVAAFDGSS